MDSQNIEFVGDIEPPNELRVPLKIKPKLMMTPGPTNIHPRVSEVLSQPIVSHMGPQFVKVCTICRLNLGQDFDPLIIIISTLLSSIYTVFNRK